MESTAEDLTRAFRDCMGEFATGVVIVTSEHDGEPAGMTVNSFTSVSLRPLLILVSLAEGTRTLRAVRSSRRFWISVLSRGQGEIARAFARPGAAFPGEYVVRDEYGGLTVPGAAAYFWCALKQAILAGDHELIVGEVREFRRQGGEPLIFHRGTFTTVLGA